MSEKQDDRAFLEQHRGGDALAESIGWHDAVLEFDDLHGEAGEVCDPYVEFTGVSFENPFATRTFDSVKVNFYPRKTGAMFSALKKAYGGGRSRGSDQKATISKAAKQARVRGEAAPRLQLPADSGLLVGVDVTKGDWAFSLQGNNAGEQGGAALSVDRTDMPVPNTADRCQLDARAVFSNMQDVDDDLGDFLVGKLQCDNWSVKAALSTPEGVEKPFTVDPAGYLSQAPRAVGFNASLGKWVPMLGGWSAALQLDDADECQDSKAVGFRGWGVNVTKYADDDGNNFVARSGMAKVTAAVTYERFSSDDGAGDGWKPFYASGCGSYSLSSSCELANGRMVGVKYTPEGKSAGVGIPLPAAAWVQNGYLRLRGCVPSTDDEPMQIGIGLLWRTASYAAEVCVQLRRHADAAYGFRPRVFCNINLRPDDDDE
eukprot:TRINITY_DN33229_c0_g1_i1.p1 TRINITY_DN33229_c0_g1~~TRINITY_DN33229_c0_g1_i1.p1  ORF type:complete len:430 (+),score=129.69 TRINITY_DN33229_c0_g1_i1:75-1364(+)